MTEEALLQRAREEVASQYAQPYMKSAILRGDWDRGSLVQNALKEVRAGAETERAADAEVRGG